jgi:predicted RecA/RadA family phage recombinase
MKNFIHPGKILTVTAPYALTSGHGCLVGSIFGVSCGVYLISDTLAQIETEGVFDLVKTAANTFAQGALVYWDDSTHEATSTASGNKLIGVAEVAASSTAAGSTVRVKLAGTPNYAGVPAAGEGGVITKTVVFTENATNTIHTGTVTIPAGATIHNIQIVNTVLWGATSALLTVGDDFDPDGYFDDVNCKATDLAVGEVLDISNAENWGGKNGAYLVAATGRKGSVQTGNSGIYYGVADHIIGVMTVGTPASTAGRTFMTVSYSVGTVVAAVATGP